MGCQGSKPPSKPIAADGEANTRQPPSQPVAADDEVKVLLGDQTGRSPKKGSDGLSTLGAELVLDGPVAGDQRQVASTAFGSGVASQAPTVSDHSSGVGNQRRGMLRKQRTQVVNKNELDIMVTEYACHDSHVLSSLGKHCKEARWKVQIGHDTTPVDIRIHVDKSVFSSPEVGITSDGQTLFHSQGGYTKANMHEDFRYKWPFRATITGIDERNFFELRPHTAAMGEHDWLPATITGQREDGKFEVLALLQDNSGIREIAYPAVDKADIRVASTRMPLEVAERFLMLEVPRECPWDACLSVDGKELVTHYFARPSPPGVSQESPAPQISLQVARDRSRVTADVGHSVISHYFSGEARAVSQDAHRLSHTWVVQLGPLAEHTIVLEKKYTLGKVVSLAVDGAPFVEATAEDIDCSSHDWECKFRFVGDRTLDFEVHETNNDGSTLESKGIVIHKQRYSNECTIKLPNDMDLRSAELMVDDVDFRSLPIKPEAHSEENLSVHPEAFKLTYGILVPYKVNHMAPCGIFAMAKDIAPGRRRNAAPGWLGACC